MWMLRWLLGNGRGRAGCGSDPGREARPVKANVWLVSGKRLRPESCAQSSLGPHPAPRVHSPQVSWLQLCVQAAPTPLRPRPCHPTSPHWSPSPFSSHGICPIPIRSCPYSRDTLPTGAYKEQYGWEAEAPGLHSEAFTVSLIQPRIRRESPGSIYMVACAISV